MTIREVRFDEATRAGHRRAAMQACGALCALCALIAASCGARDRRDGFVRGPVCGGFEVRMPDCQELRNDPSGFRMWQRRPYAPQLDLAELTPYRNYLAVTEVEPAGYHFSIAYDRGLHMADWTAEAPDGTKLMIDARWGGAPVAAQPVPAAIAETASKLEARLRERCGPGAFFVYTGDARTVWVTETVVDGPAHAKDRHGWQFRYRVPMDPSLGRIVGEVTREARGYPGLATDAQWLPSPAVDPAAPVFGDAAARTLEERIAEAARRFDDSAPPPSRAAMVPAIATMLPPGVASRVGVRAEIDLRAAEPSARLRVAMTALLELRDAVLGAGATGEATLDVGATRLRLHARLSPRAPREPFIDPSQPRDPWRQLYRGTLDVRLEDSAGVSWVRSYNVDGLIDVDAIGDAAFAADPIQVSQTDLHADAGAFEWIRIELRGGFLDEQR